MLGLVLVSHGGLAQSTLETASEIVGPIEPALALAIRRHEALADIEENLRDAIRRVDRGHGALVLADMFGGTASNVALQIFGDPRGVAIEVVTGFNLPMTLKASSLIRGATELVAAAQQLRAHATKNVIVGSEALKGRSG